MDASTSFPDLEAVLAQSGVHMRNRDDVIRKVAAIAQDGPENLLFLSDFDMTLTRYWINGTRGFTSYQVVERSPLMSDHFQKEALKLTQKYHPIEVSANMSLEEKIGHMIEWWEANHKLMIESKVNRRLLKEMVANANVRFRDKCEELFSNLDSSNVPLLIFSAGLGDTLLEVFRQFSTLRPNMHVVSNRLIFDKEGIATGHTQPLVHSYNKGKSPEQLATVEEFIVEDDLLSLYKGIYDIVLTGDTDMTVVNSLVRAVLHHHECEPQT
jgi:5'-nucleotidase